MTGPAHLIFIEQLAINSLQFPQNSEPLLASLPIVENIFGLSRHENISQSQYSSAPAFSASAKTTVVLLYFPWISESTAILSYDPLAFSPLIITLSKPKVKKHLVCYHFTLLLVESYNEGDKK